MRRVCLRSYITGSKRIDHKEDTKLAVDAEEQEALHGAHARQGQQRPRPATTSSASASSSPPGASTWAS